MRAVESIIDFKTLKIHQPSEIEAYANLNVFVEDIKKAHNLIVKEIFRLEDEDDPRGYFNFALDVEKNGLSRRILVEMPGVPLQYVRYLGPPQEPMNFIRMDVDRSNWLWCFAVDVSDVDADKESREFHFFRCSEEIEIHNIVHRCFKNHLHKGKCEAKIVVAGYTEKELGPNIWTCVKWKAARNILTSVS